MEIDQNGGDHGKLGSDSHSAKGIEAITRSFGGLGPLSQVWLSYNQKVTKSASSRLVRIAPDAAVSMIQYFPPNQDSTPRTRSARNLEGGTDIP
jgi:hypothetical protein